MAEFLTVCPCVDFLTHGEDELTFANLLMFRGHQGTSSPNHDFEEGLSSPNS